MPDMRAQNDLFLAPPPGCGALRLEPVARLYLALPLAVRPPLRLFSPLPRDRLTPFRFLFAIFSKFSEVSSCDFISGWCYSGNLHLTGRVFLLTSWLRHYKIPGMICPVVMYVPIAITNPIIASLPFSSSAGCHFWFSWLWCVIILYWVGVVFFEDVSLLIVVFC